MPQVFNCASCSAPLEFQGSAIQKCGFCGSTIIVPSELLNPHRGGPFGPASGSSDKAPKLAEIRRLISAGKKLEAIKMFRETFAVGLKEAKDAVEALEQGEAVDVSDKRDGPSPSPVRVVIDRKAVASAGKAIGGTILVVSVGAILFAIAAIAATYFFLRSSADSINITNVGGPSKPSGGTSEIPDVEELLKIGGEGTGAGKFKDNRCVAVDGEGNIYSADYSGGRIQVFDEEGKFLTQWSAGEGMNVYDLAADRLGNVVILNSKGIRKYEGDSGEIVATADNHTFRAITVMPDGKVIAAGRAGITIYGPDLKIIREFKAAHKDANTPLGFESIAVDGNGTMFLLDRLGKDIIKFSADGKFLNRVPAGLGSPNDIALDPTGNIYVTETSSIKIFTPDGQPIKAVDAFQAFGITFNDAGEMFVASRPYVLKLRVRL